MGLIYEEWLYTTRIAETSSDQGKSAQLHGAFLVTQQLRLGHFGEGFNGVRTLKSKRKMWCSVHTMAVITVATGSAIFGLWRSGHLDPRYLDEPQWWAVLGSQVLLRLGWRVSPYALEEYGVFLVLLAEAAAGFTSSLSFQAMAGGAFLVLAVLEQLLTMDAPIVRLPATVLARLQTACFWAGGTLLGAVYGPRGLAAAYAGVALLQARFLFAAMLLLGALVEDLH